MTLISLDLTLTCNLLSCVPSSVCVLFLSSKEAVNSSILAFSASISSVLRSPCRRAIFLSSCWMVKSCYIKSITQEVRTAQYLIAVWLSLLERQIKSNGHTWQIHLGIFTWLTSWYWITFRPCIDINMFDMPWWSPVSIQLHSEKMP